MRFKICDFRTILKYLLFPFLSYHYLRDKIMHGCDTKQCVVVGRRLTVLQWKHNAAWTIWCSSADTDTVDGFLLLKEFTASETPSLVTMIESIDPANEWTLCCGARHHFELICASGASKIVHMEATPKPHLVAALDLREDEEPELLLCYNSRLRSILTLNLRHQSLKPRR